MSHIEKISTSLTFYKAIYGTTLLLAIFGTGLFCSKLLSMPKLDQVHMAETSTKYHWVDGVLFKSRIEEHPSPSHVSDLLHLIKSSNHTIWDLLVNQRIDEFRGDNLDKVLRTSTNKSFLLLATEIEIPEKLALVDGQPFDQFNLKFHSILQDLRMNQDMADHLFHRCFFTKISEKSPKLISALRFLRDRLREANVTYVLDAGSLIGSERLFSVIPHDYDFDFRFDWRDKEKLKALLMGLTKDNHWKLGIGCLESARVAAKNMSNYPKMLTNEMQSKLLGACQWSVDFFKTDLLPNKNLVRFPEPPQSMRYQWMFPVSYRPFMGTLFPVPNDFANYYKVFYGKVPHSWCKGFEATDEKVELPHKVSNEPFMNRLLWNYFQKLACPKIALPCEFFHNKIPFKIKFTMPDSSKTVELRIKPIRPKTYLIDQIFAFA
ncbi:hypothetical protein Ciccas_009169 [Cichlidogyrus casuarinus]|uniref:Uncharacterized protein n=1 Tax=Cichlidogyrus casuarinus TaxID=1844966 RepID=A0ABD2PXU7_9PLAT